MHKNGGNVLRTLCGIEEQVFLFLNGAERVEFILKMRFEKDDVHLHWS